MRIMAIDYGDAHTGIAISDPTGLLAGFTTVINAYRPDRVTGQIALLAKEHRMGRMNYELSSMSGAGAGEATGNTLVVEFYMENESGDGDYTAVESFDEFRVSTAPEDIGGSMTFYRHR